MKKKASAPARSHDARSGAQQNPHLREIGALCHEYFLLRLDGRIDEATRLLARIKRRIRGKIADGDGPLDRLWLQLADLYQHSGPLETCLRQALKAAPKNPEAHAELALLLAKKGQKRLCRKHCMSALENCSGYDIEEIVIDTIREAVRTSGIGPLPGLDERK